MILLLFACQNDTTLAATEGVDVFLQNPAAEVDILLVVDDSCSMAPYQAELGTHFGTFIQYFAEANVDYRVGVTTTDNQIEAAGSLVGPPITPQTADADATFAGMVAVGTEGSTLEMGLETAWKGMSNVDFIRPDARLSVIVVSDEEDASPRPVNEYLNQFFDAKGGRNLENFVFSAITVTNPAICTSEQAARATPGDRYIDAARQTHGTMGNLCETGDRFRGIVTEASLAATRLQSVFFLEGKPNASTLSVTVQEEGGEATEIPCDAGDWTYTLRADDYGQAQPAVVFDLARLPPSGSQISVRYRFGNAAVDEFCL